MKRLSFVLLLLVVACKPAQEKHAENPLAQRIDAYINEYVNRIHMAGLTVAITRNDSIIYTNAFGYRNIDTQEPMKRNYFFHWASVSKTFVATAIMQLVEQGKLKLDEKLVTYLPYFKLNDPNYKNITLRQMLNHTSGIGDVEDYEWDKPQYDEGAPERFVRSLANDKMIFAPGTDWAYSNTAYEILGVLITKTSGMPFETYVKKNIFEPLEMKTTSFIYPEIPDSLRVSGHVWAAGPAVSKVYPYNRIHAPSSTLNSNVEEMTHYAMAHLHRGEYKGKRILADSSYNLLWTNSINVKDKPQIGLSWWLNEKQGVKVISHSGGDTGFRSFLAIVPEKNISIEVVSNYDLTRTGDIAFALLAMTLGKKPDTAMQQIGFAFTEVMKKKGLDSAKAFYKKTSEDSVQRKYYLWKEEQGATAYAGYLLMDAKMFNEAIEVFKFNVEQFPKSGYSYSHLAKGYAEAGDKKQAIAYYEKAIQLKPEEKEFKDELKKLK